MTERSDTVIELVTALSKFQGSMKSVAKTSANPFFRSKYADLDSIWEACRQPLAENGLALVQTTAVIEGKTYLVTALYHTSGQHITGCYPITPMKQVQGQGWLPSEDPQSIGSAITYARRYAMSAMLGISADEDDDAEKAMGRTARKEAPKQAEDRPQAARTATPEASEPSTMPSVAQETPPQSVGELLTRATEKVAKGGLGYKNRAEVFSKLGIESAIEIASLQDAWAKLQETTNA